MPALSTSYGAFSFGWASPEPKPMSAAGGTHPASRNQFCAATLDDKFRRFYGHCLALWKRPAPVPVNRWRFEPRFPCVPAVYNPEVQAVVSTVVPTPSSSFSERAPRIVGGSDTLDNNSFTIKISIHRGVDALAPIVCVLLPDAGPIRLSSREVGWIAGDGSVRNPVRVKRKLPLDLWGGAGKSALQQTLTSVRLIDKIFRAHFFPPSSMGLCRLPLVDTACRAPEP